MAKFFTNANVWDATLTDFDKRFVREFRFIVTTIYDIRLIHNKQGKLVGLMGEGTNPARTTLEDKHEFTAFQKIFPLSKDWRVLARGDMKREIQQLLGKRSLEYMDNVLSGRDTYDDD